MGALTNKFVHITNILNFKQYRNFKDDFSKIEEIIQICKQLSMNNGEKYL